MLNCQAHDIPSLVAARLIKPLGNPPINGIKFFSTAELLEQTKNHNWLVRVTAAINDHWHNKNARKGTRLTGTMRADSNESLMSAGG